MVGRSTRPLPGIVDLSAGQAGLSAGQAGGPETPQARKAASAASAKPNCLVVDFVGNSGKHKLITSADILGGNASDEALELAVTRAKKAGKPMNMSEALDEAEEEIKQQREQARLAEAARRARVVASARFTVQSVDPFDVLAIKPVTARGWDAKGNVSDKCRNILQKHMGLDPNNFTQRQAMALVREQFRRWDHKLCSFKQAKVLRKYGYSTEVSFNQASSTIDALAKNGWQKLPEVPV